MTPIRPLACALLVVVAASAQAKTRDRDAWVQFAKGGFQIPAGRAAVDLLVEMNPLLASTDPVLRDEVAYSAAETWIRAGNPNRSANARWRAAASARSSAYSAGISAATTYRFPSRAAFGPRHHAHLCGIPAARHRGRTQPDLRGDPLQPAI